MHRDHYKRTDCRLCRSSAIDLAFPMAPTPVGDDYRKKDRLHKKPQPVFEMDVYQCRDCGLIQLLDVVSPKLLYGEYLYETSISMGLTDHFKAYAKGVSEKLSQVPGSLVVDIGCNDGTLLRAFANLGFKVAGVDPASEIAKKVKSTFGIDVEAAALNPAVARKVTRAHGKAALVTASNVVANIDDLEEFAASVVELLDENGVFVLESGYALDLVKSCIFDNIYHEHISYFSVKPLTLFCKKNGLELFDVEHAPTKGGSIRCYIQRKGGKRKTTIAVEGFIQQEEHYGLYSSKTLRQMGERISAIGIELRSLLAKLSADGKIIAGYGASVGSSTVLHEYNLDKFLSCIFDENPVKFDTFSPGHHLPVHSAKKITEIQPDYILILSWRYAEPIMAKSQNFASNGGKFITFLPDVRIV